jgi:CxxC-x17-CxxC domain-containing protein
MKDYKNRGGQDKGRNFSRPSGGRRDDRGNGERVMYSARCGECGNSAEVPFKPSGDRPVLCRDCFGGKPEYKSERPRDTRDNRSSFREKTPFNDFSKLQEQLRALNLKVDAVLNAMNIESEVDVERRKALEAQGIVRPMAKKEPLKKAVRKPVKKDELAKAVKKAVKKKKGVV